MIEEDNNPPSLLSLISNYCEAHHETTDGLCEECDELHRYAEERLANCPYGDDKPLCSRCETNCYKPDMSERMVKVMRYNFESEIPD